jgi:hypothetical protein
MIYGGVSFEAEMAREQAEQLAGLMEKRRPTRPEPVLTALLEYSDGRGRLLAVWRDREARDRYLAETPVPHGTKLFRDLGLEPEIQTFDVLEFG